MIRKIKLLLVSILIFSTVLAEEGMWLPSLIQKLNIGDMQEMGCELDAEEIYSINHSSLKDAIVALDRGSCTAELVSAEGLLLTNHHCAHSDIQQHSAVEHDYLMDGFWAMTKGEELPNPGKTVTFLIKIEDVTDQVLQEVEENMEKEARRREIYRARRRIERQARQGNHYEAQVKSFYNSNKYFLLITETFKDIRLVGAPPSAIGNFGGDTDNWMWPRHTGDFSMYRIYTAPDGKPSEFSEDNIPYQSKHFLPVTLKGIEDDDFAMVMGYPGTTYRYKTSYGVNYTMKVTNTVREVVRGKLLDIWGEYMLTSQKARIQYDSKYAKSANYYKNSIGQNKGLKKLKVVEEKEQFEKEFTAWVNADKSRAAKYGNSLRFIEEAYSKPEHDLALAYASEALIRGPEIFEYANGYKYYLRLFEEPEKNLGRILGLSRSLKRKINDHFKNYDAGTDQKVVAALLKIYADNNDPKYHPEFFKTIQTKYKGDFEKYTAKLFKKSMFHNKEMLLEFLKNPTLKALEKDMGLAAAIDIFSKYAELSELVRRNHRNLEEGKRLYLAALMEMQEDKVFYPDANSTQRLSYGKVDDYEPKDGIIYDYYTTSAGYLEKEIPNDPEFHVPERLKKLIKEGKFDRYAAEDGTLRTCFITNNDITGGNSGSPVINGKGHLIGIAFDGNWEALSGDIAYEPQLQRCINVDIRFVLWVIDIYAGASHLVDEMVIIE